MVHTRTRWRRVIAGVAMCAVAGLGLVGCSSGGSSSDDTFKVWLYSDPSQAESQMWQASLKELQKRHPDLTIDFQQKAFQQVRANGAMVLSSSSAPDVLQFNQGTGDTGFLAKNGLIANLDDYAKKYDWASAIPTGGQFVDKYDSKGVMGSGDWYGVADFPIFVTLYYNKTWFEKYGLTAPTTFDQLETDMQTFVDNGVTPLSLAGGEYPGWQLWYELALAKAERSWVDDFILFKGKVDFHGPEMTYGAEKMADWVKRGFISSSATSLKADDAATQFASGKAPILISGSWYSATFQSEVKDFDWGVLPFPGNKLFEGSGGNTLVVPTSSKHKDLAAEFIDITLSPTMQAMLGNLGNVPITGDATGVDDAHAQEIIQVYNQIQDGLAYWPDMSVPGYDPPMVNAFQSLINGTMTPSQVLDAIKAPYEKGAADYR